MTEVLIFRKWARDIRVLPLQEEHKKQFFQIHRYAFEHLGSFPDLASPRSFGDKIQWLKLFDQDLEQVEYVDKRRARQKIAELVGEENLVPLLWSGETVEEFCSADLPRPLVLKATHDSGSVFILTDPNHDNEDPIYAQLESALARPYGAETSEWAYLLVQPSVIVERYLLPSAGESRPLEWKFHCVEGRVSWVQQISWTHPRAEVLVDRNGEVMPERLNPDIERLGSFVKPVDWEEIVERVERVGGHWRYVRVDGFYCEQRFWFGETTFHPRAGVHDRPDSAILGERLQFSLDKTKKPVISDAVLKRRIREASFPAQHPRTRCMASLYRLLTGEELGAR